MLGIKNMKLDDYEVYLDIFENETVSKKLTTKKAEIIKTV